MRRRTSLVVVLAIAGALLPRAASAVVATSCSFNAGTATVTAVIGSGADPTLERSGEEIWFDGAACGTATVTNTDAIAISAPDATTTERLTISVGGGQFAPGKTAESSGQSEIEINEGLATEEPLTIVGSADADTLFVRNSSVDLNNDGDFDVTFPVNMATTSVDGSDGADVIRMHMVYQSSLDGGLGDDTIYASDFAPSAFDGGGGTDNVVFDENQEGFGIEVRATGGGDATVLRDVAATDTLANVETVTGSAQADTFYGSAGEDHFGGGGGNDWFLPNGGDDVIEGGDGLGDTLSVGASPTPVTFDMTAERATGEGTDSFSGIEVLRGSPNGDEFRGDPTIHSILEVDGFGGQDVLDLSDAASGQTVYLTPSLPIGGLWDVGIGHIVGSPYRDKLLSVSSDVAADFFGRHGNDRLAGGPLDDTLRGGAGNDRILGKAGTDTCYGGTGADTISGCELPGALTAPRDAARAANRPALLSP